MRCAAAHGGAPHAPQTRPRPDRRAEPQPLAAELAARPGYALAARHRPRAFAALPAPGRACELRIDSCRADTRAAPRPVPRREATADTTTSYRVDPRPCGTRAARRRGLARRRSRTASPAATPSAAPHAATGRTSAPRCV